MTKSTTLKYKAGLLAVSLLSVALIGAEPAIGRGRIELCPMITVTQTYDDNIFLGEADTKSDGITTVSPELQLIADYTQTELELAYAPSFVFYNDYSEEDNVRHRAELDLLQRFGRTFSVSLTDEYLKTEQPFESGRDTQAFRRSRSEYERNDAEIEFRYQYSPRESLSIGYHHDLLENEDPAIDDGIEQGPFARISHFFNTNRSAELSLRYDTAEFDRDNRTPPSDDYTSYTLTPKIRHWYNETTNAFLSYSLTDRDYESAPTDQTPTEDYKTHSVAIGVDEYRFDDRTHFSGEIGYFIQDREHSDNTAGFTLDADLRKRIERGNLTVRAATGQTEELLEARRKGFTRFERFSLAFSYRLLENLSSFVTLSYRHDSEASGFDDETYQANVGIGGNLHRWLRANLNYGFREYVTDDPGGDGYVDNRLTLRISSGCCFPSPAADKDIDDYDSIVR